MKRFKYIQDLPQKKWLKIIGKYERGVTEGVEWYYEEEIEK
jgi:hypothetical protein